jgi:hypothetical protein
MSADVTNEVNLTSVRHIPETNSEADLKFAFRRTLLLKRRRQLLSRGPASALIDHK